MILLSFVLEVTSHLPERPQEPKRRAVLQNNATETHHHLEHCFYGPRNAKGITCTGQFLWAVVTREGGGTSLLCVCVFLINPRWLNGRSCVYITVKRATQKCPWYQPALKARRAALNEYALVFTVRKQHMPRSSSLPNPSVLSFLTMRWLSLAGTASCLHWHIVTAMYGRAVIVHYDSRLT